LHIDQYLTKSGARVWRRPVFLSQPVSKKEETKYFSFKKICTDQATENMRIGTVIHDVWAVRYVWYSKEETGTGAQMYQK